jgi:hypothetical protein
MKQSIGQPGTLSATASRRRLEPRRRGVSWCLVADQEIGLMARDQGQFVIPRIVRRHLVSDDRVRPISYPARTSGG